jgi:hypothetical protein
LLLKCPNCVFITIRLQRHMNSENLIYQMKVSLPSLNPDENYTFIRIISWYASIIFVLTAMNISMAIENFSIAITTS